MTEKKQMTYTGREQTLAINKERTSEIIGRALDDYIRSNAAEKIPLSDLNRVKQAAQEYLEECASKSFMPTVRGVAARLGVSRFALYDYKRRHPDSDFSKWLEDFSDMCGEVMMTAALDKSVDTVAGIFTAKARYNWRESIVIETPSHNPLGNTIDIDLIEQKYQDLPDE